MYIFDCPEWVNLHRHPYEYFNEIPLSTFRIINEKLKKFQSVEPLVSVVIPTWNEEISILNCISSFSNMKTEVPFELIVVNNNSVDDTQKTIDNLNVRSFFQRIQGCGPARQMGQENAKGKYILLADADCIYPDCWIDTMLEGLKQQKVVCVYGRYSFIGDKNFTRPKLFFYEVLKDIISELRHVKRPYLNAFGMSMGYVRTLGLEVGFVNHNIRGEDGRLCFDLMKYGKIIQIRSRKNRVWTYPRTLQLEGGFRKVLYDRITIELKRFLTMFSSHPPHNTKESSND